MQLTRAADYGIRIMIFLAAQPDGAVVPKAQLAEAAQVPDSFLTKILQALARAGFVQTRRGVQGGSALTERGAQSSILDVVEAIDGPISLNICLNGALCDRKHTCVAHNVWVRAQEAMLAILTEAKIRELASKQDAGPSLLTISQEITGEPGARPVTMNKQSSHYRASSPGGASAQPNEINS